MLAARLGDDSVRVEPYREGVDSWVDLVMRRGAPFAVVRSSKVERRPTRYEGLVDYGQVLEKEVAVARLLRAAGVPTPAIIAWQRTADPDREPSWMLVEFVPHQPADQLSRDSGRELGAIARRIHAIEPAGEDLRAFDRIDCWRDWIRQRILARLAAAARYMPLPDEAALEPRLRAALAERPAQPRALLHLDLRGPNLAIDGNRIVSVFDLANAIVGDPYLELARIRGCGLLTPAFLEGYGGEPHLAHDRALDAYELDLAALLVVVSREEMNDERLHEEMVARTTTLLCRLESEER
jgi:aminoglycoside phosphotransferase (APT) family kinase protein